ncbi:MAG: glycosyltransferase family 4 protein [Candidatus Paceibacterota bacterium]|jgi:glycosyltransferase involved in cell wall biosynthesis
MATRLLYVITKANWGGAQRYVYDLAVAAKREGFEVAVAHGAEGSLRTRLAEAGIRTIEIAGLDRDIRFGKEVTVYRELTKLFRHERPDAVHLNSAKAGGIGALAARVTGVPRIIFTAHGWAFNEGRPWWQRIVIRILSWVTVLLSHTTICVSEAIRRDMSWMPCTKRKLVVIHHGIACAERMPRAQAREALLPRHQGDFWIGMLSELHPTKRVIDALFAFASLRKKYPDTVLVILGEGEERKRLEKAIVALDLTNNAFLAGFVREGASYLQAFDMFLHSSRSEALGYAILEAGCASLPCVATRVGGIPEIIDSGKNGLLVPPERPANLALAMQSLLDEPEKGRRMGEALHETIRTRFSKEAMVADTLRIYGR